MDHDDTPAGLASCSPYVPPSPLLVLAAGSAALSACGDDVTNNYSSEPPTFTPDPIVTHDQLQAALTTALSSTNGGLDFPMWATVVDRKGSSWPWSPAAPQ